MTEQKKYAYMFEANSIQQYLMAGGKLADMVAASELVEQLTGELLDEILKVLDLKENTNIHFSRRAGGAFFAFLDERERAEALRDLMAVAVPQMAPGLGFVHCVAEGASAFEAAEKGMKQLGQAKSAPQAVLPVIGPLVMRAPRTGAAAVENSPMPGGAREYSDAALCARRKFKDTRYAKDKLAQRFAPKELEGKLRWPTNLQGESDGQSATDRDFPFNGEQKNIALLHIDGNGLGQMLIQLKNHTQTAPQHYVEIYRGFSECLKNTTEQAARSATQQVLLKEPESADKVLPARPLILGGDDLTIILRADLAFDFAQAFMEAFEAASQTQLTNYKQWLQSKEIGAKELAAKLPEKLTSCGGMVIQKASQPFSLGNELAVGLCDYAKDVSRKDRVATGQALMPSSLAFHKLSSTWSADREAIAEREYRANDMQLSLGAYQVGSINANLPKLTHLRELCDLLEGNHFLGINGVRQMATEAHQSEASLEVFVRRVKELVASKKLEREKDKLNGVLQQLYNSKEALRHFLFRRANDTVLEAPVADLLCMSKGGK